MSRGVGPTMKHILILIALSLSSGCAHMPIDGYDIREREAANIAANEGKPPVNFLGLKLYPHAAAKILMTKHNFGSPSTVTVTSRTYTRGNTTTTYHTVYGLRR
jgi:hypothetical protein